MYGTVIIVVLITVVVVTAKEKEAAQVEVRAVLINCEPQGEQCFSFDIDAMRFEREELYKHSVLRSCRKKLALTVKSISFPNNSGDEYIPIAHVFQGPKKRVRLLNPYVLRLRREPPLQAYKLRKIETVCGKISSDDIDKRVKRGMEASEVFIKNKLQYLNSSSEPHVIWAAKSCLTEDRAGQGDTDAILKSEVFFNDSNVFESGKNNEILFVKSMYPQDRIQIDSAEMLNPKTNEVNTNEITSNLKNLGKPEQQYDMFEVGNADLWYTIQVQLFEKLSTPDGRTVWNDLSKGTPARVGSLSPEWTGPDMSVRYRSLQWISRGEFVLPPTDLCLLVPTKKAILDNLGSDKTTKEYIVVPREDVIMSDESEKDLRKRNENLSFREGVTAKPVQSLRRVIIRTSRALFNDVDRLNVVNKSGDTFLTLVHKNPYGTQVDLEARADENQLVYVGSSGRLMTVVADSSRQTRTVLTVQATNTGLAAARFRVLVRDCNPDLPELLTEKDDEDIEKCTMLSPKHTSSFLLNLPFEIPVDTAHCSVVLVNGDGQSVAVRDVAIRRGDRCFCVWHCECVCLGEDPKLLCRDMPEVRQIAAGLTPRERSRQVRSVCYRDVLSLNICVTAFGVLIILLICGLIKACLGLLIRCVGAWGLSHVLQMPRKLDHYYETALRDCKVVYDDEGWPVHPDTKKRTVRLVSLSMEFILNLIFFVTVPCVIFCDALRRIVYRCKTSEDGSDRNNSFVNCNNNCYTSNNVQNMKTRSRRRNALQRWMTPGAQDLSLNIWQKSVPARSSVFNDMRPLLREQFCHNECVSVPARESCADSEPDDTEYVLVQMQKSRESLTVEKPKFKHKELVRPENKAVNYGDR